MSWSSCIDEMHNVLNYNWRGLKDDLILYFFKGCFFMMCVGWCACHRLCRDITRQLCANILLLSWVPGIELRLPGLRSKLSTLSHLTGPSPIFLTSGFILFFPELSTHRICTHLREAMCYFGSLHVGQ